MILNAVGDVLEVGPADMDQDYAILIMAPVIRYAVVLELGREPTSDELEMIVRQVFGH